MTVSIDGFRSKTGAQIKPRFIAIIAITILATALRLYSLGEWSFWIEEHHSIRDAANFDWSLSAIATSVRPLYFLLLVPSLNLLGVNEWSARLVATLIGVITVPFIYYVSRKIHFNGTIALCAALIMAISPWHIYWSQNARFYTLLLLLGAGSTWAFYWGVETNRKRYIYLSLVLLGLAGITHAIAAILVPVYIAYFVVLRLPGWNSPPGANVRNVLPLFALPLIGYIILELVRVFLFQDVPLFEIIYIQFFDETTASFIGYSSPLVMVKSFIYYIGIPVAFFSIIGAWVLIRDKSHAGLMLIISAFLPFATVTMLTIFASTANRYAFFCISSWFILGAVGFYETVLGIKNKQKSLLLVLPVLLVLLWRDPAIKDVIYHLQEEPLFRIIALIIPTTLSIALLYYCRSYLHRNFQSVPILTAIVILFAHPILMGVMYFQYQDGHRGNLKAASSFINRESEKSDIAISSVRPVADYYIDINVEDFVDYETLLVQQETHTIWFIEDYGVELIDTERRVLIWLEDNCVLKQDFDHFVAGRTWKLRVHKCP